jgi:hypothetical protein
MPSFIRRHDSSAGEMQGPGWYEDPEGRFQQRYRDNEFTAYVGRPDRIFWDLAFCGRMPNDYEARELAGIVLQTDDGWVELGRQRLRLGYSDPKPLYMTVAIPWLQQFQVENADHQHVRLVVYAEAYSGDRQDPGGSVLPHGISISITFRQRYETLLYGLCSYAEKICGRGLSHPIKLPASQLATDSAAPLPPTESPEPPPAEPRVSQSAETSAPPPPPADNSMPQLGKGSAASSQPRPADRALVLSVALAPDTSDWLSFAAPTTYELLNSPTEGGPTATFRNLGSCQVTHEV